MTTAGPQTAKFNAETDDSQQLSLSESLGESAGPHQATHALNDLAIDMIVARVSTTVDLEDRLREHADRLRESGSVFLIVDWELAYETRPQADAVFARDGQLRNEIVWVTRRAQAPRGYHEKHHTVLWYVKDPSLAPFTMLTMPRSMETRRRFGNGRIVSSVSQRTGRRAPARVEGASLATPLNDVWVWDQDFSSWVFELEEMDGRAASNTHVASSPARRSLEAEFPADSPSSPEYALFERLLSLAGYGPDDKVLSLNW